MKQWFDWKHLGIADSLNKRPKKNPVVHYFIHMYIDLEKVVNSCLWHLLVLFMLYSHHYLILNY